MYPARLCIVLEGFIALMVAILGTDAILKDCQVGWKRHSNFCYKTDPVIQQRYNWTEAYDYCKSLGAKLSVPSDLLGDEQLYYKLLQTEYHYKCNVEVGNNINVWLGCKELEGNMKCSSDDQKHIAAKINQPGECQMISLCSMQMAERNCNDKKRVLCKRQLQKTSLQCQAAFKQDDTNTMPSCLLNNTYKDIPLLHPIQCCIACYKDPDCLSFNLSGKLCQLNNATIFQSDAVKFVIRMESCVNYNIK